MNKFKFYLIVTIASVFLFSCSKDEPTIPIEPPRDYKEQYKTDIADIETYLKSNYIEVVDKPGEVDDQDVTIKKLEIGDLEHKSIWDQKKYQLLSRTVKLHNIEEGYKLYYLVLRQGVGESPCNVDGVLASYKGTYLSRSAATETLPVLTTTLFEELIYPQATQDLFNVIRGWKEIFPQFKSGTSIIDENGTVTHNDFGAGIMFIPSGLAYFNDNRSTIPAYSPLIFSFKLYKIERLDHDFEIRNGIRFPTPDGIFSFQEDIDGDGYLWTSGELPDGAVNPDDTHNDGIPNFVDVDDDDDKFTTKLEIKNPATGLPYPFENIPRCTSGKKNYLDATCHP